VVETTAFTLLRWILLPPLVAAAVHGVSLALLRRPLPRSAAIGLSVGAPALSFVVSLVALIELAGAPEAGRVLVDDLFTWVAAGDFGAEFALLLDPLSAVVALLVTGVGTLIHIAAVGLQREDVRDDRGFNRFFAYLNLATFSMLTLVLGENLLVVFLGWQGLGFSTFLLIGFWYTEESGSVASMQSFVLGRVGDFGFLAGTFLLTRGLAQSGLTGTAFPELAAGFDRLLERSLEVPTMFGGEWPLTGVIALCFALAAIVRGAQWPLGFWRAGTQASPLPATAIVLAVCSGTAGVFLLGRLAFVFAAAPAVMAAIAWLGAITSVAAAFAALVQTDLRKTLIALMGVQLGWMFVAAGCGAFSAALFHAVTAALFMPLLFLAAGSIARATRGQTELRQLGGLWDYLHRTKWLFAFGALALVGFPLSSGFYSREGVMLAANLSETVPYNGVLYLAMLGTILAVGFAVMRLQLRIFHGRCVLSADVRGQVSEPDGTTLFPLYGLAFLTAMGGFLGPAAALNPFPVEDAVSNSFANFLAPLLGVGISSEQEAGGVGLAALSTLVSATGVLLAWYVIQARPELGARVREALPLGEFSRKLSMEPAYDAIVVRPLLWLARRPLMDGVESRALGGLLVGSLGAARRFATGPMRIVHAGRAQRALLSLALGCIAIAAYWVA
jgi:NADH-quinone oxidoreductase subunit L